MRCSSRARSRMFVSRQGPWSKAWRAAAMARRVSMRSASAAWAITRSSIGQMMSRVASAAAGCHWPAMRSWVGVTGKSWARGRSKTVGGG